MTVTVTAWMDGWLLGSLADWIASAVALTAANYGCDCDCVDGWMATWLSGGLDCFGERVNCYLAPWGLDWIADGSIAVPRATMISGPPQDL